MDRRSDPDNRLEEVGLDLYQDSYHNGCARLRLVAVHYLWECSGNVRLFGIAQV